MNKHEKDEHMKYTMGMFDLIKGVAMLVIIMQHTFTLDGTFAGAIDYMGFEKYILGFLILLGASLMPFFIEILGFDFLPQKNVKRIQRKVIQFIKPYMVVMCSTVLLNLCLHYLCFRYIKGALKETLKVFGGFMLGLPANYSMGTVILFGCGPVWFLMAIAWGYLFLNLIFRLKNEKLIPVVVILACILGLVLGKKDFYFFCIPQGLISTGYIYMGYLIRKKNLLMYHWDWRWMGCFVIATVVSALGFLQSGKLDNMADDVWNLGIISVLVDGVIGILLLRLFMYLNNFNFSALKMLKTIGRYSLYVFCVHSVELIAVPWYVLKEKMPGNVFMQDMVVFLLRCILIFSVSYMLRYRQRIFYKLKKVMDK